MLTATAPLAAAELAAALDLPTPAITSKLQALVRTELAARSRKPERAAPRVYAVTAAGRALLRRREASEQPPAPAPVARTNRWLTP